MSAIKRKLSISLNRAIEPLLNENKHLITVSSNDDYVLLLKDSDQESNFYFGIQKERSDSNGHYIYCSFNPSSPASMASFTAGVTLELLGQYLKSWISNIAYYAQESILDDPILQRYQDEFYDYLHIVEDDADSVAFNYDKQLLMDDFLTNIGSVLETLRNNANTVLINEIQEDAAHLQETLTSETKNGVMKKLSMLFAKARKAGLPVSKALLDSFGKEAMKSTTGWLFKFAVDHAAEIPAFLHNITIRFLTS